MKLAILLVLLAVTTAFASTVTTTYDPDEFEIVRKSKGTQFIPYQGRVFKAYTSGKMNPFTLEYRDSGELMKALR